MSVCVLERENSRERKRGSEPKRMGQIVRRKKKGRPTKSDLERRHSTTSSEPPSGGDKEPRRSLRRRNVRYTFDFDDYEGDYYYDDDDGDEEVVRKREKKLRLLLKLQGSSGTESTRRVDNNAPSPSAVTSSESDDDEKQPAKKRKVVGSDDEIDGDDDEENEIVKEIEEAMERKGEASGDESVPGTPAEFPATELHMPDKKTIELVLDKLQKKDIYGVYAEPVDPEELPDYHEVIKNPMDFGTVRRKLGNGSYSSLEQLESDVLLICSNAMQYNAPDTVYHKQASSIQELARRKFQRLRDHVERSDVELKSEDKTTSSSIFPSKQAKKPFDRSEQEPAGSDFSSGAALATTGELHNGSTNAKAASCERPRFVDGHKAENSTDTNVDKGEESLPGTSWKGKGFLSRLGRKPSIHDENRRATYNLSDQPPAASESIFSTFEGEAKQLVPVGLQADHSYARSLARFAATLGSVAWKVASERIEQALPAGTKFGRGWVGEYEPLPTPVLILKNCTFKEPIFPSRSKVRENEVTTRDRVSVKEPESVPTLDGKPLLFGTSTSRAGTRLPAKEESPRGASLDARVPFFCPPGAKPSEFVSSNYRQQRSPSTNSVEPERRVFSTPSGTSVEPERKSSSATASPRGTSLDPRAPFFCSPGATPSEFIGSNSRQQHSVELERKSFLAASRNIVEPERNNSLMPSNRNSAEPEKRKASLTPSNRNSAEPEKRKSSLTPSRNSAEPEKKSFTQVESNHTISANKNTADFMSGRQIPNGTNLPASWSADTVPRSRNLMPSASFKQPNNNGTFVGEQHNGKSTGLYSNGMLISSANNYPNQMTQAAKYFPQQQEQGLSDPVQLMKMMAEKNQNQQKPPNNSAVEIQQAVSSPHATSSRREDPNNAAVTAARAWMSLGAGGFKPAAAELNGSHKMQISSDSLYNGTRQPQVSRFRGEFPSTGIQFQPDKNNFPVHAFVQQPVRMMNEAHSGQFQNRPMGFPQLVTADLSRFQMQMQMQSPWRGVNPQMQQRQKQESLPPDLNIGFQSVGSPGRQSSGVLVDSQQPDLALQL